MQNAEHAPGGEQVFNQADLPPLPVQRHTSLSDVRKADPYQRAAIISRGFKVTR